jgi:polysaccharide biosynthesis/export protein
LNRDTRRDKGSVVSTARDRLTEQSAEERGGTDRAKRLDRGMTMLARWLCRCAGPRPILLACLAGAALAGCDAIPTFGPNVGEVIDESQMAKRFGFTLVNVDSDVLRAIAAAPHAALRQFFPDDRPIVPKIGPGDVLAISIYEAGAGELFAPPAAQQLTYGTANVALPALTVDPNGAVTVPFAGTIRAAGLTPMQVQASIRRRLGGQTIEPQVLVTVAKDATNVVTVTGTVKNPGRFQITPASETLMQIVAEAGGSTIPAADTVLQLTRNGRQIDIRLSELLSSPRQDIHAWPADYINLIQAPRDFLVYGAVYKSGTYPLSVEKVTLTQAIGRAGGMIDTVADSRGVFVFRYEFPQVLNGIPAGQVASAPPAQTAAKMPLAPVIYRVDMKTAAGIFYAEAFPLRDKDLVFVPSAPTIDWGKYIDLFRVTASPATSAASEAIIIDRGF